MVIETMVVGKALGHLLAALLRALDDGWTPLFAVALASVANIGLDLLFVLGFGWVSRWRCKTR